MPRGRLSISVDHKVALSFKTVVKRSYNLFAINLFRFTFKFSPGVIPERFVQQIPQQMNAGLLRTTPIKTDIDDQILNAFLIDFDKSFVHK